MTERRTQNSILFLTTLGVYLGLVLVGATPVLGHAATTRNFELLDEIEFKDDLDKKPDDAAGTTPSLTSERFSEFAKAYAEFVLADYDSQLKFWEQTRRECPDVCRLSYLWHYPTLAPQLEELLGVSDYSGRSTWSEDEVFREFEIKYSPSRSELVKFQTAFSEAPLRKKALPSVSLLILANSAVSINPKNLHLTVVTRLPRAALIPLLANDAK